MSGWRFATLILFALAACAEEPLYTAEGHAFGVPVKVAVYGENKARAAERAAEVLAQFGRLEGEVEPWKGGLLSRVNSAFASGETVSAPRLAPLIERATWVSVYTDGLLNPAGGRLARLWGFDTSESTSAFPDHDQVAQVLAALPRMSDVQYVGGWASSSNRGVWLDFSGFIQGYALDRGAEYLRMQGIKNALITVGNNAVALGSRGERAWRATIPHPREKGSIAAVALKDGEALASSGDYQRYFEVAGRRYCPILDPRTGFPAQGIQAASVLAPAVPHAGVRADAAAKALFVSGIVHWREAAAKMDLELAMLIDEYGKLHVTPALMNRLTLSGKDILVHVSP
ncbi:MAG TPA: FAD:protein FMN transferase [Burkholderiales bacterium]|nr:FAD:protein FMN transferase [Burkholderiales bacterium]